MATQVEEITHNDGEADVAVINMLKVSITTTVPLMDSSNGNSMSVPKNSEDELDQNQGSSTIDKDGEHRHNKGDGKEEQGDGECEYYCGGCKDRDEYDSMAESRKPAQWRGFVHDVYRRAFKYREMVWEQRDGRWCGKWRWAAWKEREMWEKSIKERQESAIRAWNATDAPQEVLLQVIECLVGRRRLPTIQKAEVADVLWETQLSNLALVCRAWYDLVAPTLYSILTVRDAVLGSPLRQSLVRYARRIVIKAARPLMASARMAQMSPHPSPAVWLAWEGQESHRALEATYHPRHASIYAQLHRSFSTVIKLDLSRCTFHSSSDLLRLLASLPALERVDLRAVTVSHISDSVVRRGRSSASLVRYMFADDDCSPPCLPFVTHWWTWPCAPAHYQTPSSHGLSPAEQRLVVRICGLVTRPTIGAHYYVDPMDTYGRTWVAHIRYGFGLQLEFHASQDDLLLHSGASHIRHCLLRVPTGRTAQALIDDWTAFSDVLRHFAFLETIVIERNSGLKAEDVRSLRSLSRVLRKFCRAEVRHRTCEEGHALALKAKKSRSIDHFSDTHPLSSFWCLEQHAQKWMIWLSDEYWDTLGDEDKRGWDPPLPPTTTQAASGR